MEAELVAFWDQFLSLLEFGSEPFYKKDNQPTVLLDLFWQLLATYSYLTQQSKYQ